MGNVPAPDEMDEVAKDVEEVKDAEELYPAAAPMEPVESEEEQRGSESDAEKG